MEGKALFIPGGLDSRAWSQGLGVHLLGVAGEAQGGFLHTAEPLQRAATPERTQRRPS